MFTLVPNSRCGRVLFYLFASGFIFFHGGTTPSKANPVVGLVTRKAVSLTAPLVREGMRQLLPQHIPEVSIRLQLGFSWGGKGTRNDGLLSESKRLAQNADELQERIDGERNQILREQLEIQKAQLELEKRRNELLLQQNRLLTQIHEHQTQVFQYQKEREESVLRKLNYTVPAQKLIVVVADFSSGDNSEGKEVADEIAYHLRELKKFGIDVHVLAGEVKLGVTIRSEEMARDAGRHFPADTSYAVIWGTMSPRTVGMFRPHLTCVEKFGDERGVSTTFSFDLDAQKLPNKEESEEYRQHCYEQLIGTVTAAVPACFAAHEIRQERVPKLDLFYRFLGENEKVTLEMQEQLKPLTQWVSLREKHKLNHLHALEAIQRGHPMPRRIANRLGSSVLVLIADKDDKPILFIDPQTDKKCYVYIDVAETLNRQFLRFLNEKGNQTEGGAKWLFLDPDYRELQADEQGKFRLSEGLNKSWLERPILNVNWFGAKAYCKWAGKELPMETEWIAAGQPKDKGEHPWGDGFHNHCNIEGDEDGFKYTSPPGSFARDFSRIGCYDMGGNVAEWCLDYLEPKKDASLRVVKGGSFQDKDRVLFTIQSRRGVDQVVHKQWVGFRGVVRIPIEAEK